MEYICQRKCFEGATRYKPGDVWRNLTVKPSTGAKGNFAIRGQEKVTEVEEDYSDFKAKEEAKAHAMGIETMLSQKSVKDMDYTELKASAKAVGVIAPKKKTTLRSLLQEVEDALKSLVD